MHGWPIHHVSIANGEAGTMPRTLDHIAVELTFRERATQVRAGLSQRIHLRAVPDQQNRSSIVLGADGLSIG
jgi:hypothetical protein